MESTTSVYDIAKNIRDKAHTQAQVHWGVNISPLKGKAEEGQYTQGGVAGQLSEICKIKPGHSNATGDSKDPCKNKDKNERFKIGKVWAHDYQNVNVRHQGILLPPRRRYICTSNLENLDTTNIKGPLSGGSGNSGKLLNNSFLGDVLLTAYKEGDDIVNNLRDKKDYPRICTAMKYSFADLGDIIRGRDLWSQQSEQVKLQKHIEAVFKNIKNKHPQIKSKYDSDDAPYTTLREDWWAENRDQIWKAMTCTAPQEATLGRYVSGGVFQFEDYCGNQQQNSVSPPPDDYIPQRLRWMTEWAENYCRHVNSLYDGVTQECEQCKNGGANKQCTRDSKYCTSCSSKCTEYKEHVKKWKEQWKTIKVQYQTLYDSTSTSRGSSGDPIQDQLDKFFEKLKGNKENNYKNLEDFIESMQGYRYCKNTTQKEFKDENSIEPTYVFSKYPKGYLPACMCMDEPCDVVETILKDQDGNDDIENCKAKYQDGENNYPKWDCDEKGTLIKSTEKGACMPPRRQKLCISNLTDPNITAKIETPDDLRKVFIKSAAAETFFAWKKYIKDKHKENTTSRGTKTDEVEQIQLKEGKIPHDFKRIMYYTYGDFRDMCLGKDIGNDEAKNISNTVKIILNSGKRNSQTIQTQSWWKTIQKDVWKGMLCALSHHIKDKEDEDKEEKMRTELTENKDYEYNYQTDKTTTTGISLQLSLFEGTPQFLRWFTEWADEFCRKRDTKIKELKGGCGDYTCTTDNAQKPGCKDACQNYTKFIGGWEKNYHIQKQKFDRDKREEKYPDEVDESTRAYEYLNSLLTTICKNNGKTSETCKCMEKASTKTTPPPSSSPLPQSLDQLPTEYEGICKCAEKEIPRPQAAKPAATKPVITNQTPCNIVNPILKDKDRTKQIDRCLPKDEKQWECDKKIDTNHKGACMPPRRQLLCIHNLAQISGISQNDFRTALIKCAAIETFFAWDKYKKDKEKVGQTTTQLDSQLKEGTIPDDFKRIMFYTYSDYRDLVFGTDISNKDKNEDVRKVKEIIEKHFPKNGQHILTQTAERWWNDNGKDIWDAMVCGLSHAPSGVDETTLQKKLTANYDYNNVTILPPSGQSSGSNTKLSDFVETPQFLRWMTEWAEHYCREQKKEYEKVKLACNKCSDEKCENNCEECQDGCKVYKEDFVGIWGNEWTKQSSKYAELYTKATTNTDSITEHEERVVNHLKNLQNPPSGGSDAKYSTAGGYVKQTAILEECQVSKQDNFIDTSDPKYAFAEYPKDYKEKCNCNPSTTPGQGSEDAKQPPQKPGSAEVGAEKKTGSETEAGKGTGSIGEDGPVEDPGGPVQTKGETEAAEGDAGSRSDEEEKKGQDSSDSAQEISSGGGCQTPEDKERQSPKKGSQEPQGKQNASSPICDSFEKIRETAVSLARGARKLAAYGTKTTIHAANFGIKTGKIVLRELINMIPDSENSGQQPSEGDSRGNNDSNDQESDGLSHGSQEAGVNGQAENEQLPEAPPEERGERSVTPPKKSSHSHIHVLKYGVPIQIGLALASIAFYFYLKKKPKSTQKSLFRVIDVSKNKDRIPTKSSNRYIPYGIDPYKGRTYIYVEQLNNGEDYTDYYCDTTDITSSESEYEDINDIYPYKSPKYKTLIEVILEPSKRDDTYTTHSDVIYDVKDMHHTSDMLTDTFISTILQRKQKDFPQNNLTTDIPIDTHPIYLDEKMDEKPFITSIQDKYLHGGGEHIYNINWNVPTNTFITTNTMDDPKYVPNNIYTEMDLIINTLTHNSHIDIYSEILKRKEKELYGTKYT
ncbi:erythrocyte membrane protein 1, PfEMP1,putative [Plasmodium sp. gorilla clade G3]|nr:erythrocyte membrane protein 1, PfEMP1,putative [Plasmodium sp. gorilla clade G3]